MRNVLIVDDSETVRMQIAHHLRSVVPLVQTVEAEGATDAMETFRSQEFDLVFLDGVLAPGVDSNAILRAMLEHRPGSRVVITSARPREHAAIVEGLGLGAYAYLPKPVRRANIEKLYIRMQEDAYRLRRIP